MEMCRNMTQNDELIESIKEQLRANISRSLGTRSGLYFDFG